MIRFNLICECEHEFEIWFGSSSDFDKQKSRGFLVCPQCGSNKVDKALMAPPVTTGRKKDQMVQLANMQKNQQVLTQKIKELRDHMVTNSEDVGKNFPDEARKIHYGESEARGIRGEANLEEASDLVKEGIEILPIPALPEDHN